MPPELDAPGRGPAELDGEGRTRVHGGQSTEDPLVRREGHTAAGRKDEGALGVAIDGFVPEPGHDLAQIVAVDTERTANHLLNHCWIYRLMPHRPR